jgi:hypothetical protein
MSELTATATIEERPSTTGWVQSAPEAKGHLTTLEAIFGGADRDDQLRQRADRLS